MFDVIVGNVLAKWDVLVSQNASFAVEVSAYFPPMRANDQNNDTAIVDNVNLFSYFNKETENIFHHCVRNNSIWERLQ